MCLHAATQHEVSEGKFPSEMLLQGHLGLCQGPILLHCAHEACLLALKFFDVVLKFFMSYKIFFFKINLCSNQVPTADCYTHKKKCSRTPCAEADRTHASAEGTPCVLFSRMLDLFCIALFSFSTKDVPNMFCVCFSAWIPRSSEDGKA